MVIFYSYVKLPEGNFDIATGQPRDRLTIFDSVVSQPFFVSARFNTVPESISVPFKSCVQNPSIIPWYWCVLNFERDFPVGVLSYPIYEDYEGWYNPHHPPFIIHYSYSRISSLLHLKPNTLPIIINPAIGRSQPLLFRINKKDFPALSVNSGENPLPLSSKKGAQLQRQLL